MVGIYIHIPFCKSKCFYCNFFSIASTKHKQEYVNALIREIELQKNYFDGEIIKTIYFGGGTPSLLSVDELTKIINVLYKYHNITPDAEITLEANPDDLTKNYVKELQNNAIINRLSIGIQSFFDEDLKYLKRNHTGRQAETLIKRCQDAGFENLSIDFIYGIPTLSNKTWEKNLTMAFMMQLPHVSAYNLTIEPKTILDVFIREHKQSPLDEEHSIEQFKLLMSLMKKNDYIQYEISNFCIEDFYSKHNSSYWSGENYLGLGPSAHSFNGISRQWNISNISKYINHIEKKIVPFEKEILSCNQQYNEYIMTSLRTMWGCDVDIIKNRFGQKYVDNFIKESASYLAEGKLIRKNNKFFLSEQGKLLADGIASDLFSE